MMSTTDRPNEVGATLTERLWPVIDVYGRVRRMLSDERVGPRRDGPGRAAIA